MYPAHKSTSICEMTGKIMNMRASVSVEVDISFFQNPNVMLKIPITIVW